MFEKYFKTAWRNLLKHRSYTAINVMGLILGIASCLVIFLVVQYELGYDKFHSKSERIYRVTLNAIDFNPCVSLAVAAPIRNDFPELEAVTTIWYHGDALVKAGQKRFEEKEWAFADEYFFSVFDYVPLSGTLKNALKEPNSIVLTESLARKYFGNQDALGQMLNLDNVHDLKVTAIIKDLPGNTHLPFKGLVSFSTLSKDEKPSTTNFWSIPGGCFTYIVTPPHYDITKLQSRIHGFVEKNWGKETADVARLPLQPLTDIHFDSRYLNNTISYTTSKETYYMLAAVALLIIIIACINFINLATAQAIRRAKEVGVRKVLGSHRWQLIAQFLGETALIVTVALVIALIVIAFFLPQLALWLDISISIRQLLQPSVIFLGLLSTGLLVLLAGIYPALVQSAFKPVESFNNKPQGALKGWTLRKTLVVVQFAISQIMIIGTLVVAYQMDFFQNRNLGFNKDAVISFVVPNRQKGETLRHELSENPGVKQLSFSSGAPVISSNFTSFIAPQLGLTKDDVTEIKFIDEAYTDMFELKMLAGNKITRINKPTSDTVYNVVVNETMIHKLNIQDPHRAIGEQVILNGNWHCTITGVVKDFQSESKHKAIRPCVLIYRDDAFYMASARLAPAQLSRTIAAIDKSYTALFPDGIFSYEFLDDHIAAWYRQEQKEYTAFRLFAGIAILIGCLGLYGLVAFAVMQRTKEVGIRKVLGASVMDIVYFFSKEFVVLIVLAFVIAAPVAFLLMNKWLQSFAYQVNIGAGIFVIALLSSFIIAACTIAYQAFSAATANPVKSLRTE